MRTCRISNSEMQPIFSLGNLYVSDFVNPDDSSTPLRGDLTLCFSEESKLLQLQESVPESAMYGKYWYRSGTNLSMVTALHNIVWSILERVEVRKDQVWLDIASNDGTLLSCVPSEFIKIGIDPVEDNYVKEAKRYADDVIQDFFSKEAYFNGVYGNRKANVVTAIAMFYDLDDPGKFLNDVYEVMDDDGLFVLQLSYTPLMIEQLAFDNICHEHICYYSLTSLKYILDRTGFRIVDCELNEVNGGSFRVYLKKEFSSIKTFGTAPFRDVANFRVKSILSSEDIFGFNDSDTYEIFYEDICRLRDVTVNFIMEQYDNRKTIWGYGASTKGNTLLQWYDLKHTVIDGIADCSPHKHGLRTVGTYIPIYPEETMRKMHPDYLLMLPWHFVNVFKCREANYLRNGGQFIVPCPKFEIIKG